MGKFSFSCYSLYKALPYRPKWAWSNFKPLPPAVAQSIPNTRFVCRIFNFHLPTVKTRPAFIETSLFAHRSLVLMLGRTSLKHHPNKVHLDPRLNFRKISANSFVSFTLEGVQCMRFAIFRFHSTASSSKPIDFKNLHVYVFLEVLLPILQFRC